MTVRSSLDRRLVPFREPNSHKTRTEHVQNEGCLLGEKGTCNCNVRTDAEISEPFTSLNIRHWGSRQLAKPDHLFPRLSLVVHPVNGLRVSCPGAVDELCLSAWEQGHDSSAAEPE
jgi:hypothetical protein